MREDVPCQSHNHDDDDDHQRDNDGDDDDDASDDRHHARVDVPCVPVTNQFTAAH